MNDELKRTLELLNRQQNRIDNAIMDLYRDKEYADDRDAPPGHPQSLSYCDGYDTDGVGDE